jgi:hypothetical protein
MTSIQVRLPGFHQAAISFGPITNRAGKKGLLQTKPTIAYTARGMVLYIARQGIHVNRAEDQQNLFIAR